jgi:hypothetical protein
MQGATALLLLACTSITPTLAGVNEDDVHARCLLVQPGMNYREALALMAREPDSTLSGHSAAGPGGEPVAGSFAIDFWQQPGADGRQRVSTLHYAGGVIKSVDCGRLSPQPSHPAEPGAPSED